MAYSLLFGNDQAKEAYRDPASDQPNLVRYTAREGQFVTRVKIPDGVGLAEAFQTAIEVLRHHMVDGGVPKWVEGDNVDLVTMLKSYYGARKARPKAWGTKNKTAGGKET